MALTDDYLAALERVALVFDHYRQRTGGDAVLVGGAATAIYTSGLFPSGDFDIVAASDAALNDALAAGGFRREDRPGFFQDRVSSPGSCGFWLSAGFRPVVRWQADRNRLVRVEVRSSGPIVLPSIEDLIADRMGQNAVAAITDDSRLRQAMALFTLAKSLDVKYLTRRILDEGGDPALLTGGNGS